MSTNRKPLIAGNWKMNLNHHQAKTLIQGIANSLPQEAASRVDIAVFPPFTALQQTGDAIVATGASFALGAQDLSSRDSGAYTGDVSGEQLSALGCRYVLIGHSERREHHSETDEHLAEKVVAAHRHHLIPVLCVGEGLDVRQAGNHIEHSVSQLKAALTSVNVDDVANLVVAYEPVWAIGTGKVATPTDAQEVCHALREAMADKYGLPVAVGARILYGGSVKSSNVAEIMSQPDVDGALVGGASLDATEFAALIGNTATTW